MNKYENMDWENWKPEEKGVVVYVSDKKNNKLLLMIKKTGLGAGKVNAPGGRLEKGESFYEAVIRECQEEVYVNPIKPEKRAELHFQFVSGYALYGEAFFTDEWEGEIKESDEADPFWCDMDKIPWEKMWEDDLTWLPKALEGKKIRAYYVFDEDKMLSKEIIEVEKFAD